MPESKDALKVHVIISIVGKNGYSECDIHRADLTTTGPLDVTAAIEEAKALAQKCVNSMREAAERAAIQAAKAAAAPADKDEIAF